MINKILEIIYNIIINIINYIDKKLLKDLNLIKDSANYFLVVIKLLYYIYLIYLFFYNVYNSKNNKFYNDNYDSMIS